MQKVGNIDKILSKYPFIEYNKEERVFVGYIYVDEDDKYHLKIDISEFPNSFPKVIELDERIPRKANRHINKDNTLCFTTKVNEEILLKTIITDLETFFEHILLPYLINNSYYEINRKYKFGEYNHHPISSFYETYDDIVRTYTMYKNILGISNFVLISNILGQIAQGKKYRPNDICYCGSGKKIKKCDNHEKGYRIIKKIDSRKLKYNSLRILELRKMLLNEIQ